MEPLVLNRKENGMLEILKGHNKIKILKMLGITQLKPKMYNYSDGSYNKDIILMNSIEDERS